ncbi:MAG: hypothetical protein NTX49_04255 [Chlamydiae bacterium]|nr:hypothetical protein [Chlamydiota bacterium]
MTSNYYSLVDIARGINPQNSRLPETPSPIDNDDFRTAASPSPSPASPVASPAASPLLGSALSALRSPAQQALESPDDDALIVGVSELDIESDADSLRISPDSLASPTHETPNLLGRVSTAPTATEASLADPIPVAPRAVRALDDALRPLSQRTHSIPLVVHRAPAQSLQELETRANPSLYPDTEPSLLTTVGNALAGLVGRIPGAQTLGNLWHAIPGTQTLLNRVGQAPQALPRATAPRLPQNTLHVLEEGSPDHIAIDVRPANDEEAPELFIAATPQHSAASTSALSQVANFFERVSDIVAPRPAPSNPDIYEQLAIRPRPDPLATILGDPRPLTSARVTVTHNGITPFSTSAQGERDMVVNPTTRPTAQQLIPLGSQLSPYDHFHQGATTALEPVESTVWGTTQAVIQTARHGTHALAGLVDVARMLATPGGANTLTTNITALREAAFGPAAPTAPAPVAAAASAAEPSTLTVVANGLDLAQQLLPHAIAALRDPNQLIQTVRITRQAFMAGLSDELAAPESSSAAASSTARGVANLADIRNPAEPPVATPAQGLIGTITTLLGAAAQAIQDPHQAGRDARTALGDLIGGATGAQRRDLSASAASAAATPQGFFSQIFTGLRNAATKKFTELRFTGIALTLAQKVEGMEDSPAKVQLNEMLTAIGRFQKNEIPQATLEATLTRIMNGQDETGRQISDILHLHINGFELPIRTEGAGTAEESLAAIQAAHPLLAETTQTEQQHQISVQVRQIRLVNNISTMAPMNLINERLCGGLLSKEKIAEILGKARETSDCHATAQKEFFAAIDELTNLSWPKRWAAKFTYWAFSGLSSTILSSFIQGMLEKVQSSVQLDNPQREQEAHTAVIAGINKALTAYNLGVRTASATLTARPSDDVIISDSDTMLGNELARPPYNEGETKETLYNKAIDKAVNEILPPLGWTKSLKDGVRKLPVWAQALLFPLTTIAWVVVGSTEWISDVIIRWAIRNVVKYTKILDTVIDLSVDQVSRNGYTHAINKLVLQQLKLIGEALDKEGSGASSTSIANKEELRKLAKELFKTLETQRQSGQANPDAATTIENFKRSIYHLTSDFSADAIALIIDQGKNILLDPKMIAMRQDSLLEALNAALESSTTATSDEMIALETEIMKESDTILNKALKKIVHSTLEHKPAELQEACNLFTKKIKDKATAFVTQLRDQLGNRTQFETSIAEFTATMRALLNESQNAPLLEDSAASIQRLIAPIATAMRGLNSQLEEPELRAILNGLDLCIGSIPDIIHVDAQIGAHVMKRMERITCKVAYQGGKEFFNEAWKLLTKKPVWRFAAHRAMLGYIRN